MKRNTFILFLLLLSITVWGQRHIPQVMQHDTIPAFLLESEAYKQTDYWKKRNLFVGIGAASLAVGTGEILFDIVLNQVGDGPHGLDFDNLAPIDIGLLTTGSALIATSIWCFVKARQYRKKAIDFSLHSVSLNGGNGSRRTSGVALRITF